MDNYPKNGNKLGVNFGWENGGKMITVLPLVGPSGDSNI
jgi:hypothetical protein